MYDAPPGVIKEKNFYEIIPDLKLMSSQNSTNNSIEKIVSNNPKEINPKSFISKNIQNRHTDNHINSMNSIEFNNIIQTPKNPFLVQSKNSMHNKNKEDNFYLRNDFNKNNSNKRNIKSYVSPSFDYNFKNNHKNNNIKLNIKNNNPNPIKLQNSGLKNLYKNKNKTSKKNFSNSSIDIKASSSSIKTTNSMIDKMKKINYISKKNSKKNINNKINYNTNYSPDIKKYLSFTPGPVRKTVFIKNKVSAITNFEDNRRKEDIKMIFEREFRRKIASKKHKNNKSMITCNNSSLLIRLSRNIKTEENKKIRNSQSQKNINKIKNTKNEFNVINSYNEKSHKHYANKTDLTYDKYHSILEQKIIKLNKEISNLKEEEKNLSFLLVNYQEKEKECNEIRKIREEIDKYKIIIEKSTKDCEEYALEIQQIKNLLGEQCTNTNSSIDVDILKYNTNFKSNE